MNMFITLTNLHDLSDRPLDRNTHVVSIPESPRWEDRTAQHSLITSEATRASYVLHHPYSVFVYRFSFVHGRSSDNESTLRHAASIMRDFIYYVYSLHYDDPLPGQRVRINIDQYLIHVFQTYHTLRNEDYPLLSTNLLNPDAAARDVPSPIPIFDISTSVDSITASFRIHHWLAMVADADSYDFPLRKYSLTTMMSSSLVPLVELFFSLLILLIAFVYGFITCTLRLLLPVSLVTPIILPKLPSIFLAQDAHYS